MKVLIIPDVHGTDNWKKAEELIEEVDKVVFLGDYFDNWENKWPEQGKNFEDICSFKRKNMEKVEVLLGNHDWSYISPTKYGSSVSGHQNEHAKEIHDLLVANRDIIKIASECDGWVFSHAGFSNCWVEQFKYNEHCISDKQTEDEYIVWDESEFGVDFLNNKFFNLSLIATDPACDLNFCELLDWNGTYDGFGNEVTQGPLWIRPDALGRDKFFPNQVVGHTEIALSYIPIMFCGVLFVDGREHDNVFVFDTENQEEIMTFDYAADVNEFYRLVNEEKGKAKTLFGEYDNREEGIKAVREFVDLLEVPEIVKENIFKEVTK